MVSGARGVLIGGKRRPPIDTNAHLRTGLQDHVASIRMTLLQGAESVPEKAAQHRVLQWPLRKKPDYQPGACAVARIGQPVVLMRRLRDQSSIRGPLHAFV